MGAAFTDNEHYGESETRDMTVGYRVGGYNFRLGYNLIDRIPHERDDGGSLYDLRSPDTGISIDGYYLSLTKTIALQSVQWELGGGLYASKSEVYFEKRKVNESDDESPFINIKLIKPLSDLFALQGDWKYIHDVTGGNINLLQVGIAFSF